MLKNELEIHLRHVETFWLNVNDYYKQAEHGGSNIQWLAAHSMEPHLFMANIDTRHWIMKATISDESGLPLLDASIKSYKDHINQERLKEYNENISYLLDLVEVVQNEVADMRAQFTSFLNINLIFSTISSSLSFTVASTLATSSREVVLALVFACAGLMPMFIGMLLGANCERSVSINHFI